MNDPFALMIVQSSKHERYTTGRCALTTQGIGIIKDGTFWMQRFDSLDGGVTFSPVCEWWYSELSTCFRVYFTHSCLWIGFRLLCPLDCHASLLKQQVGRFHLSTFAWWMLQSSFKLETSSTSSVIQIGLATRRIDFIKMVFVVF